MYLSKTDFKEFLICQKCLWLKKKRPDLYVEGETSDFLKKLIKDGYKVEEYFQKTFPEGISIGGSRESLIQKTQNLIKKQKTIFQATFQTDEGLFAKIDILEFDKKNQKWNLYEVKASSEVKKDLFHNHIKDITFQKIVLEKSGIDVGKSYLVYLNKKYIRQGDVDLNKLFIVDEFSEKINEVREETELEINKALEALKLNDVDLDGCECIYRSCGQRCDCFSLFNPQVPEYSVAHLFARSKKKIIELANEDIFDIKDIPDDFKATDIQKTNINLQKTGMPIIEKGEIHENLSKLKYPLYFLDYETYGEPIPLLDGYRPNQQVVFQYSLHVFNKNGEIKHFEYLAEDLERATGDLLKTLQNNIGSIGSVIVWNEGFEKSRNNEMAVLHPEYKNFLENLNSRVFDLMKVFQNNYLHPDFKGSASIKKVLPVLCPKFSYSSLEVQNGAMAIDAWGKMMFENKSDGKKEEIKNNLLKYCELDTLAMVEIFKKLKNEISEK
jgi:CRISPR/Cas system-associated exonuclease Cas4 (RecB family)